MDFYNLVCFTNNNICANNKYCIVNFQMIKFITVYFVDSKSPCISTLPIIKCHYVTKILHKILFKTNNDMQGTLKD